jgi:hypothetical protein
MEIEGCYMKFITPCYVENNYAHDAVADLDYSRNLLSKELMKRLKVSIKKKEDGRKEVTKRLLVQMNRDVFFVEFDVNPSDNEWEHSVILGRAFLEQTKGIIDFSKGLLTIHPDTEGIGKSFWRMNPYAPEMNEKTKVFLLHRNGNGDGDGVGEKYITPCVNTNIA